MVVVAVVVGNVVASKASDVGLTTFCFVFLKRRKKRRKRMGVC